MLSLWVPVVWSDSNTIGRMSMMLRTPLRAALHLGLTGLILTYGPNSALNTSARVFLCSQRLKFCGCHR